VELVLESVIMVVSPLSRQYWVFQDTWSFEYKKKLIDEFVKMMVEKLKDSLADKSSSAKDSEGYWDKRIIKILDNIQLTI
jgi:hypothetical protein